MSRYHATVHDDKHDVVFECHVIASDTGRARETIKKHLRSENREDEAKMQIALIDLREDIESSLILLKDT